MSEQDCICPDPACRWDGQEKPDELYDLDDVAAEFGIDLGRRKQVQYEDGEWSREVVSPATQAMMRGLQQMENRMLTDFLLARIAEDEEINRRVVKRAGFAFVADEPVDPHARRLLAECEADRRIVELHEPGGGAWCTSTCESESPTGCDTLRVLALPYADHPDYDEAWRP